MTFGKHRSKLAVEVREEDPGYWRWLMSSDGPGWFAAKARAAGLCDEDEEGDS